jgi:MEMO1 family protein
MLSERPQLRPHLKTVTSAEDPRQTYLIDRLGLSDPVSLTPVEHSWLEYLNGRHTLQDIYARWAQRFGEPTIPFEQVSRFVSRLEDGLLLQSPRFQQIVEGPVRPPRCIGCYEGDAKALRRQVRNLFTNPHGAGLPRRAQADGSLRAVLAPHIDYQRGGLSYTFAFKELFEKTDATLFVIIGTSHYSAHRFSLTRKSFQTPLGIVPTDQEYIDRLVQYYGPGLFDDEWLAHLPEHSIELEVVFLQYLYEGIRPIRIVPLVVGSFHDCVTTGSAPTTRSDIARMIEALKQAEDATPESICYVISGDLAHIGPKFSASQNLDQKLLDHSYHEDQALLRLAEAVDTRGYFRAIADEEDERNICGLPPTYVTLQAARPRAGKVLHYDRYVHPEGQESVSFASVAFYR